MQGVQPLRSDCSILAVRLFNLSGQGVQFFAEYSHEAFYKIIRNAQHELPIIFVTRPEPELSEDTQARRAVIARTFLNARDNGDKNVYLIDGRTFFGNIGISDCTADGTHPNDLGMYFMSQGIGGILHEIFCM